MTFQGICDYQEATKPSSPRLWIPQSVLKVFWSGAFLQLEQVYHIIIFIQRWGVGGPIPPPSKIKASEYTHLRHPSIWYWIKGDVIILNFQTALRAPLPYSEILCTPLSLSNIWIILKQNTFFWSKGVTSAFMSIIQYLILNLLRFSGCCHTC